MTNAWDAIVVGARCAGAPTALRLAQRGYRVLAVDSAKFPSDTLSTHLLHPPAVAALERFGVLERLEATGCPPIAKYSYDFGPFTLAAPPAKPDQVAYCPRRIVLDDLLVDAAAAAGAEIRESFSVDELVVRDGIVTGIRGHAGGKSVTESARVVIGADGRHSLVARSVRSKQYHEQPPVQVSYYSYFSNLATDGFATYVRPYRAWAVMPTHDGLTLVICGRPIAEFEEYRIDIERKFFEAFELAPAFAERIKSAKREARFAGTSVPGYFRMPFGPGWVLVGDAGYNKDFITAMGISDAFRDAELCAAALDDVFCGRQSFDAALLAYQQARDEQSLPMYEFTNQFASLAPPPPEMERLLAAVYASPRATAEFVQVTAGVLSPAEFFSEANVRRIFDERSAS
jgi:flavin-dependent dehydrogenase